MGRIYLSAGHGAGDSGAVAGGTTEDREMRLTRNATVEELRDRGLDVQAVPDTLSLKETINWINERSRRGDVALEIHADSLGNPKVRGASVFYTAGNEVRKADAALLLQELSQQLPSLPLRGVKADTETGVGRLGFCRQIDIPSILMELGFLTSPEDRALLQSKRQDFARGLADGLEAWMKKEAARQGLPPTLPGFPVISVKVNDQLYRNQGILVNDNACVPVIFMKSLGVNLSKDPDIRTIEYRKVVYVKAIDLQQFKVSVSWDNSVRAVVLSSKSAGK